jgi:uncharacterized protein DUF3352
VKRALSACAVVLAIVVAGCGSTTGSGPVDPATLAPATTLAYASFELAPQGAEKQGFDTAFGKLLGADPERRLGEAFTNAVQTSGRLDYDADVKPWLGETATAVVTSVGSERPDYALLVASTDDDKARAAIDKDLAGVHTASREYRGVAYKAMDDGTANGVVGHFLVAGTEAAFKSVVDTAKEGKSLADSGQWKSSVGNRGDGKVGLAYVDVKGLLQSFASKLPGAQRLAAPLVLGLVQIHPFVATLDANADSLVADVSSPGTKPDPRGPGAASSQLIESLPADAWAAFAVPKVGQALGTLATALKANPLIGAQYERVVAQVKANTGLDLETDVLAAIGDVGVFARGSSPATAGGALVVQSPQPATLARTVRRLPALIRRAGHADVRVTGRGARGFDVTSGHAPRAVQVRVSGDGAIAAYGAPALRAAQHPAGRLGETPLFRTAAAAVGERPTFFLDFGPALKLATASPHHRNDKDFQRALPRLQQLEYLAVGARREGKLDVLRAVLGLR